MWCRIIGNQQFFLAGLALTSTLFAGVSQNMIPAITCLLAAVFGYASCTEFDTNTE
jgi:hypothetical protein